jgi:hypothetical protein
VKFPDDYLQNVPDGVAIVPKTRARGELADDRDRGRAGVVAIVETTAAQDGALRWS